MATAAPALYNTDFERAIARNKRNTLLLLAALLTTAAVFGYVIGWAVGVLGDIWSLPADRVAQLSAGAILRDLAGPPRPQALIGAAVMVGAGGIWGLVTLFAGAQILSAFVGARPADPNNPAERRLIDVVEEMAIAAGLPPPRAMVVDTPALNAFASGTSPERAMITATSGLLQACTREELQGVIGHEMSHVADYDVRYATVVAAMAGVAVLVSHLLWDVARWSRVPRGRRDDGAGAARAGLTLVVLVLVALVSIVAPIAVRLVQLAISRQREYLADATSVKLTRNPAGLIQALQRLEQSDTALARADSPVSALCIAPPKTMALSDLMATHPPLEDRIARLRNLGGAAMAPEAPAAEAPHHGPWG